MCALKHPILFVTRYLDRWAALGFMRLRWHEPVPPPVVALAAWMNSWRGLGAVLAGMSAHGFNVEPKEFPHGWRANFYPVGMAHSVVAVRTSRRRGAPCSRRRGSQSSERADEHVIDCDLTRLSRVLRILRFHAHDLNLVPSVTVYMRWGKGPKHRLRFTKTGDLKLEEAYATHFVWPGTGPFHTPAIRT